MSRRLAPRFTSGTQAIISERSLALRYSFSRTRALTAYMHSILPIHSPPQTPLLYCTKMSSTDKLAEALAECNLSDSPNYAEISARYGIVRTTLWRRHTRRTRSRREFLSQSIQALTLAQEEELLRLLTYWTRRRMPPTPQIVTNLAEEIYSSQLGKNWTNEFVGRYYKRLCSVYLRNMDHQRIKSEWVPGFEEFYRLVGLIFLAIYL